MLLVSSVGCHSAESTVYDKPTLASFESTAEVQPDEGSASIRQSTEHATHGNHSLEVALDGPESGFGLRPSTALDLSGAKKVLFDVYREGSPISVICRFFDAQDKPYVVWYYRLQPGENLVEIDVAGMASSGLDVRQIKRVYIYAEQGTGRLLVDNLRTSAEPVDLEAMLAKPVEHPRRSPKSSGLLNGDFEVGLAGWNSWGEWDDGRYFFSSSFGDEACSGVAGIKILCEKPGRGGIFTEPMFMPAGTYEFRFWAKGGPGALFRWTFDGDRSAVAENFESQVMPLTGEWREFRYEVPVTTNAALRLYFFSVGEGTVYLDAASLVMQGKEDLPPYRVASEQPIRKVTTKGRRLLLDGKPFFPMGVYLGKPSMLAGTGFNVMMPSAMTPEVIEESARSGILLTPELTGALRAHLPSQIGLAMEPFKAHPNLFAWYLCDEPDHAMMTVPPAELRLATKMARQIDPDRPTWAVVMSWTDANMHQYADTVDILATDIYPIEDQNTKRPLVEVAQKTDTLRRATGPAKPGVVVLQSSGKVLPTEQIAMTYLALTHGADGLFYWQLFEAQENPDVWRTMVDLSLEIKALTPVLTAEDDVQGASVTDKRIHTLSKRIGTRLYVLTVNESPQPVDSVIFEHPHAGAGDVKVLFEKRNAPVEGKRWADRFLGYERHVYSIPLRE
jgi:hypothetical protein